LIGRTEGNLRAARAYLYSTAAAAWQDLTRTGNLSEEHRAAIRLASTWTIHQAASVVDAAYHMAGATAVFKANRFERRFRDMHAIAQQIQARDTHYEDVGKNILTNRALPRGPSIEPPHRRRSPTVIDRLARSTCTAAGRYRVAEEPRYDLPEMSC